MKKLIIVLSLALSLPSFGQNSRWDSRTTTVQAQGGNLLPVFAIPGASISFLSCTSNIITSCTIPAVTYNGAGSACPSTAQVNPQGSLACTGQADIAGNFGAFFSTGTYAYTVTSSGQSFGPFMFTVGGGGGTSGLTSINGATGPAISLLCGAGLTCVTSGNTITISPTGTFNILSFTGGETVELGTSVVNPTFNATYTITPTLASITNTEGIGSPFALTSPFTSGSVPGTFVHSAITTTTFTLSATQGVTQTSTQNISWQPAIFGGVGNAGATSSVTASGTTAVLSTGNALARVQLGPETVGQTFGPYTASSQVVYLLLTGATHTFVDANTGFPFAFNAPLTVSFVNSQGVTVTMYLYASTNPLFGSFAPRIAS
jgi:hypothetical protein